MTHMKLSQVAYIGFVCNRKCIHIMTSVVEEHILCMLKLCIIYTKDNDELSSLNTMESLEYSQFSSQYMRSLEEDHTVNNAQIMNLIMSLLYKHHNLTHISINYLLCRNHPHNHSKTFS